MGNVISNVSHPQFDLGSGVRGGIAPVDPSLFADGFESQQFTTPDGPNSINFVWSGANYCYLVRQDGLDPVETCSMHGGPASQVTADNIATRLAPDGHTRDWTPYTGNTAFMIRYLAGLDFSEMKYTFNPQAEMWTSYWIRVPTNYTCSNAGGAFDKFHAVWSDGYSQAGSGSTCWLISSNDGGTGCNIHYSFSAGGGATSGAAVPDFGVTQAPFFGETDRGRWMQVAFKVKQETSLGASDGEIVLYRRWDGEAWQRLLNGTGLAIVKSTVGASGFRAGYVLGATRGLAPYVAQTEFLIDDYAVSSTAPEGILV